MATGYISKKILKVGPTSYNIPVSGVLQGSSCLIQIWGKNTSSESVDLEIVWFVYDPDDIRVEYYGDVSYGISAGDEHEFIGGRFNVDKIGTYFIIVGLYAYITAEESVMLDMYQGNLCLVGAVTWKKLDDAVITIVSTQVWKKLDDAIITISPPVTAWKKLDDAIITVVSTQVWKKLDSATLKIGEAEDWKKLIPWIAGAGAVGIAAYAIKKSQED